MFIPILSVVTAIFATLTILLRRKGKSFEGMLCKFISSFGFMSMAFIGFCYRIEEADKLVHPFYFCLVAFGLLFGLGGDVLLGIKEIAPKYKNKLIALGTLAFLIGHFFYLASFLQSGADFLNNPVHSGVCNNRDNRHYHESGQDEARQQDVHSLRVLFLRHCALRLRLGLYALSHALADIYYNHNRFGCVCNQRLGARVRLFHARKEKEPARYN